jgi:hypothetical protein
MKVESKVTTIADAAVSGPVAAQFRNTSPVLRV